MTYVPKDGMVHVASAVELDRLLDADEASVVALLLQVGLLLQEAVEVLDIRAVVHLVVQLRTRGGWRKRVRSGLLHQTNSQDAPPR